MNDERLLDVCDKPCTRCQGSGMAGRKGMAFCDRCCGSGIEPECEYCGQYCDDNCDEAQAGGFQTLSNARQPELT